jgi:hypothetical protein
VHTSSKSNKSTSNSKNKIKVTNFIRTVHDQHARLSTVKTKGFGKSKMADQYDAYNVDECETREVYNSSIIEDIESNSQVDV